MKVKTWISSVVIVVVFSPLVMGQVIFTPSQSNPLDQTNPYLDDLMDTVHTVQDLNVVPNIRRTLTQASSPGGFGGGGFAGAGMGGGGGFGMMGGGEAHSSEPTEVRVFALKYYDAVSMAQILSEIFPIGVYPDQRNNQLIVSTDSKRHEQISALIQTMDKPESIGNQAKNQRNLLYRIYMVEPNVEESNLRNFSLSLKLDEKQIDTSLFLKEIESETLKVTGFHSHDSGTRLLDNRQVQVKDVAFDGQAASLDDLKLFAEKLHEFSNNIVPEITEFSFDDATNVQSDMTTSMHSKLPGNVKGHIEKLLGSDIKTVGYWFGNSSISGELTAPVGGWSVSIQSQNSGDDQLELEVRLSGEYQNVQYSRSSNNAITNSLFGDNTAFSSPRLSRGRGNSTGNAVTWSNGGTILHNTVQSQIGKPVIIGYNRHVGNSRRMGALVIVPDLDTWVTSEN